MRSNRQFDDYDDEYEALAEQFDPTQTDRRARRKRKPKAQHTPKKAAAALVEELSDEMIGLEGGFETSYRPSKHEAGWLLQSLRAFYDQSLITDVLALVKGGKEASVYRCAAHESTGEALLAAKVYRPRMFRQLSNDAQYRKGRGLLSSDGHDAQGHKRRIANALRAKSAFGQQIKHTSWLMHEVLAMQKLHAAGAAVPNVLAASQNAVLMDYVGDEQMAAPTLSEVQLETDEAQQLFKQVMYNIERLLEYGWVHGDLSAYNILYWQGEIVLIDFPQVVDLHRNDSSRSILERDVTRVCEYFERFGVHSRPKKITHDLWDRYVYLRPADLLADLSRLEEE
ncbi:MAG: hypothetical protein GYB68_19220 [Chloroflexi bacterium]|nr:hypothetical protein [Chloroflexota bacterium]